MVSVRGGESRMMLLIAVAWQISASLWAAVNYSIHSLGVNNRCGYFFQKLLHFPLFV